MTRFGLSAQGMVLLGTSYSQDDKSLAGFEELAMPLFDSLYNFARWLVEMRAMPRISYKRLIEKLYTVLHRLSQPPISEDGYFES